MLTNDLVGDELRAKLDKCGRVPAANDVKYMFLTKVGGGPVLQTVEDSVIDLDHWAAYAYADHRLETPADDYRVTAP